jgi:hypothetical protein
MLVCDLWGKGVYSDPSPNFNLVVSLLLIFKNSLYFLDISPLLNMYFSDIFFQFPVCLSIHLKCFSWGRNVNFNNVQQLFSFVDYAFDMVNLS